MNTRVNHIKKYNDMDKITPQEVLEIKDIFQDVIDELSLEWIRVDPDEPPGDSQYMVWGEMKIVKAIKGQPYIVYLESDWVADKAIDFLIISLPYYYKNVPTQENPSVQDFLKRIESLYKVKVEDPNDWEDEIFITISKR